MVRITPVTAIIGTGDTIMKSYEDAVRGLILKMGTIPELNCTVCKACDKNGDIVVYNGSIERMLKTISVLNNM